MYANFLSTYSDKKSYTIPQKLYKPAPRGLTAIAELLVFLILYGPTAICLT